MTSADGVEPMLDPTALKTFRPLFVTPCFGERVFMNCVLGIIALQREAIAAGMACDFHFRPGDSLVTRVRNDCVAFFLSQPQYTHLFWIDADIGFSPLAAPPMIRELDPGSLPCAQKSASKSIQR
jgi:hypothetical protein